ncbi:hypothetical protein [Butyrivibrio sp. XPD2006]|uniref:hypothetical protein n=1 Tax=Butyrivibrio sp. XPD2006 TaxID=1280668 RepID=UPI0003B3D32E|nr:hypothetical protein [Butyrivibrio sp. XPD2006]
MESDHKKGHFKQLSINAITEKVVVQPKVPCSDSEVFGVLADLKKAVEDESYVPATPTAQNPSLSDNYIFDKEDEKMILCDLKLANFVGKALDLSKGADKRKKLGLPQEYLYVFKYPCELIRRDADTSGVEKENILIYIKVNDRKIPNQIVFVVSFHKNNPKT